MVLQFYQGHQVKKDQVEEKDLPQRGRKVQKRSVHQLKQSHQKNAVKYQLLQTKKVIQKIKVDLLAQIIRLDV